MKNKKQWMKNKNNCNQLNVKQRMKPKKKMLKQKIEKLEQKKLICHEEIKKLKHKRRF